MSELLSFYLDIFTKKQGQQSPTLYPEQPVRLPTRCPHH
nr:MAG TPA: hypothetical protein [Caudoviricetes sp.]